jgi:ATP-dependent helicase/nuclease subunit A
VQRDVFERTKARAAREEMNLLYVAVTRAKQVLVVSGHHRSGVDNAWYPLLRQAVLRLRGDSDDSGGVLGFGPGLPVAVPVPSGMAGGPCVADEAPRLQAGAWPALDPAGAPAPDPRMNRPLDVCVPAAASPAVLNRAGVRYGERFHALMEHLTESPPMCEPMPGGSMAARLARLDAPMRERLREALGASASEFDRLWQQALRLLASPSLACFFDPALYLRARNEVPYLDATGALRRVDRLVEFDDAVWVIDYKTGDPSALAPWLDTYLAQVGAYAAAMAALHPGKAVSAALMLGDGSLVRWTPPV